MNTAHRFWIVDDNAADPSAVWMTASTLEWALRKIAAFKSLLPGLRILPV